MSELKRCPFCGSDNVRVTKTNMGYYRVVCHDCFACTGHKFYEEQAEDAWNNRAWGEEI